MSRILLYNYCLAVYLLKPQQKNVYIQGMWLFFRIEYWYMMLTLVMLVISSVNYNFQMWFLAMIVFAIWLQVYILNKKWAFRFLDKMGIEQKYQRLENKRMEVCIGLLIMVFCYSSFVIVAYVTFGKYF